MIFLLLLKENYFSIIAGEVRRRDQLQLAISTVLIEGKQEGLNKLAIEISQ